MRLIKITKQQMMNFLDFLKNKQKTNYWMQNASPSEEDDGSMIAY